jgi:hypothetical protein
MASAKISSHDLLVQVEKRLEDLHSNKAETLNKLLDEIVTAARRRADTPNQTRETVLSALQNQTGFGEFYEKYKDIVVNFDLQIKKVISIRNLIFLSIVSNASAMINVSNSDAEILF